MKTIPAIFLIFFCCSASFASENQSIQFGGSGAISSCDEFKQVSIGLAISGGGARGLSTIGILKAFEEKGIGIKAISGTSMGGIMGGLYACGYRADDLSELVEELQFDSLFNNAPSRKTMFLTQRTERDRHLISIRFDGWRPVIPTGLTKGQRLTTLLTELTASAVYHAGGKFENLPIPFKTVTTDIENGEAVVLDSGSLANAMRATMAFPLAFTPVEDNGRQLMDGGILMPIPVTVLKEMVDSSTYVVAINTASTLLSEDELKSPIDIANQVTTIMTADKLANELELADYVITPELHRFESTDFDRRQVIIDIGYKVGLRAADSVIAACKARTNRDRFVIDRVSGTAAETEIAQEIRNGVAGRNISFDELRTLCHDLFCEFSLFELRGQLRESDSTDHKILELEAAEQLNWADYHPIFEGNRLVSDSALSAQIGERSDAITPETLSRITGQILNLYYFQGIDLVEISRVEIDREQRSVKFHIKEVNIDRIDVLRNRRTRDWFVRANFPLSRGEPYNIGRAAEGIDNIYGTDLFNRVTLGVEPSRRGAVVKIGVDEKFYRQVRLGWHWHERYESEQFIELLDDNLFGMGLEMLVHAQYAIDRQKYYSSFQVDRIWSTYLTAKTNIFHDRLDRLVYDTEGEEILERKERRSGLSLSLGQQIAKLGAVNAGISAEQVSFHDNVGSDEVEFDLIRLNFRSLVESFDRAQFTNSGNRTEAELQLTGDYLGSDAEFTRFWFDFEQFIPIGGEINLHPEISLGLSASGLPPSEKFYLGGSRTFYGYHSSQLPGDKLVHFSYELRVTLPLGFYLSARHDIGEVYGHTDQIKLRNLRHGVGVQLSLDTPMGPFSISHGLADNDNEETYFNLGLEF